MILVGRLVDRIFAWALLILGLVHCAFTPIAYARWSIEAIWFLSAGLALIFAGMLNLLRIAYNAVAPGTRAASLLANVLLLSLTVGIAGAVTLRNNPQVIVAGVIVVVELFFSLLRRDVTVAAP